MQRLSLCGCVMNYVTTTYWKLQCVLLSLTGLYLLGLGSLTPAQNGWPPHEVGTAHLQLR